MPKKVKITTKQKAARKRNMAIARLYRHSKAGQANTKWLRGNKKAKVVDHPELKVFYQ